MLNYGLKDFRNTKELWAKSLEKGMRNYGLIAFKKPSGIIG
jgi:hypothetical protein